MSKEDADMEQYQRKIIRYLLIIILDSYMTTTELEQVIQDYFLDIYGKRYVGKMSIQKLDPVGYCIRFFMDRNTNRPTVIYAELEDEKFLKLLK
jgi:hypothetical protein